jgi:flagellar motor protein MotB
VSAVLKRIGLLCLCAGPGVATAGVLDLNLDRELERQGEAVERHLPADEPLAEWTMDPENLSVQPGDRLELREVPAEDVETVKLTDVVPPIRFESGVADIPPGYVEALRQVLEGMQDRRNVRLHLVGHADDQPLSPALARVYGDNAGLSRERAGEVAEFFQVALGLPAESISFEWAGDSRPIASNATAAGRALNRRVEVEVWYDEIHDTMATQEVLVTEDFKRVKVCRVDTVCKLRYVDSHARRARVRNLVPPLRWDEDTVGVAPEFTAQVAQALHNLRDKQNVTVKFIGFTDDAPLAGRAERIYGNHLALSRARALRVGLAIQEALALPSGAIDSDGRGAKLPLAANDTPQGRALNRRIEVEFWYDDPLQELPDEPQLCPDDAGAELVTKVYDPPWGRIPPLELDQGRALVPPGYADMLRRAMADISDRDNVRLQFLGYTGNERLDRRTARIYGDDIGLSAARARRAMESMSETLELSPSQAEHEGRGYVHSSDVVNAGFIQGRESFVVVQVVYDELAVLDDYEGVDITRLTRELSPSDPFGLNLMRISVDGEPIDDPGRSSADIQRCTDVALERTDLQFRYDSLEAAPRLALTASPALVVLPDGHVDVDGEAPGATAPSVRFAMYSNYGHFIARSEVRLFEPGQSLQAMPVEVLEIGADGHAEWLPPAESFATPARELRYVLRVYDEAGNYDETRPRPLWLATERDTAADDDDPDATPRPPRVPLDAELLAGYGENELSIRNIPLGSGTVRVRGSEIPPGHAVWLAGRPVPVDAQGNFIAEEILPAGMHTVEVAVLDGAGNGELFLRDLELKKNDWFYVGIADLTLSDNGSNSARDALQGENSPFDPDSSADGRLAFFLSGRFREDWKVTASADTREAPVSELFSNFLEKTPEALFRRIDPDYYYPTFGDDSTVEEMAPTQGKFYVRVDKQDNHALWGNFKVAYMGNELAQVDRGLYGANARYQSQDTTAFGEQRLVVDGFAAEPGTVPSFQAFRGTGGSLYFLRHQDILTGSERLRIEVRDKDSGIVTGVVNLRPFVDYDIDYLQGRILLSEPLASTVDDQLLVRSGGLSGDEAWLVARYEYTPGLDDLDALAVGGEAQYWFNDFVKLGVTANTNEEGDDDSSLNAADLTLRKSTESWMKLQAARSEGLVSSSLISDDGGFGFSGPGDAGFIDADAGAYRADVSVGMADFLANGRGRLTVYAQSLEAGYSAPGLTTPTDTDNFGGTFSMPVTDKLEVTAKADRREQDQGLETTTQELNVGYRVNEQWQVSTGVRSDRREDRSPVVALTQEEGERTDAVVQVDYDSKAAWRGYGFAQGTLSSDDTREDNGRIGAGGAYRFSERLLVEGEISDGDLGAGGKLGTSYLYSERTNVYMNYSLENERTDNGVRSRRGSLVSGARSRLSDSASVFLEERYQRTDNTTGLTHATGVNLALSDRWNLGANVDLGTLEDRQTGAETDRTAGGVRVGYGFDTVQVASAIEYRDDSSQLPEGGMSDRTTWLFRNSLKYQLSPDWRLVGKLNHSDSDSSLGQFYDGGFTEAVLGYAYRPVQNDRLNALAKYTYFYNVPTTDQVSVQGTAAEFIQKSHIASLDAMYDLTQRWSIGGKYAYRLGQVSLDREEREFFDNSAHLVVLRTDLRLGQGWEVLVEGRVLDLPDIDERRSGALVTLFRQVGKNVKLGLGYNFTDFSEDLTDLSYDHHGVFVNVVGVL